MSIDSAARCAAHGEAPAVEVCQRCGTFLCGNCLQRTGQEVLCRACLARSGRAPEASSQAWASLYLGLAGLTCGFLPGIVGLFIAHYELKRIARGESSSGGRALAWAGRLLGWLNAALLGFVLAALLSRFMD